MGRSRVVFVVWIIAMLLLTGVNQAAAEDYYVGEYHDGRAAYLDTSSIRVENHYTQGYHEGDTYSCVVKAVNSSSGKYDYINYNFYVGQTESIYKNGERVYSTMKGPHDYLANNPVENKLLKYFYKRHEDDWNKVPKQIR